MSNIINITDVKYTKRNKKMFTPIDFNLELINSLEPVLSQSEENYEYNGLIFSNYKCKNCGHEQLVLINPETHKPYGNPKCFNRNCDDYGYSRDYKNLSCLNQNVLNRVAVNKFSEFGQLILVGYLDNDNLLFIDSVTFEFIIINDDIVVLFDN